jgi:hypothetical protein
MCHRNISSRRTDLISGSLLQPTIGHKGRNGGGTGIRSPESLAAAAVFKFEVNRSPALASVRVDFRFSNWRSPQTAGEHLRTLRLPSVQAAVSWGNEGTSRVPVKGLSEPPLQWVTPQS